MSEIVNHAIYWTGAAVILAGGWALVALLLWQAIEMTLKLFGVTKLVLEFYWDKLHRRQGQVISKKSA